MGPKADGEKSDKQLKREAKKAEKQQKKAEHKSEKGDQTQQQGGDDGVDVSEGKYGVAQMNQSREKPDIRLIENFSILTEKLDNQLVWVRARLHTSRAKGKQCFFVLRQQQFTVQCIAYVSEDVSKQMIKFISHIPKESIVDVQAVVKKSPEKIEACSQKDVELHIKQTWTTSQSEPVLPLQIEDAARKVTEEDDEAGLNIKVNQDTRLDNRILDLRTPTNQAIFRVEAGVCQLFRDTLTK